MLPAVSSFAKCFIFIQLRYMKLGGHSIYHIMSLLGYSGPEWLYLHGFSRPLNGPFFDKIYHQRLLSKTFKIEALYRRHKFILISICKISGTIKTGFEVAIQVFDGRIVPDILQGQKSSQSQILTNKASFLCFQR